MDPQSVSAILKETITKLREGAVNDADAALVALYLDVSGAEEPPAPPAPRASEVILDELLSQLVEHVGSPEALVALLREYRASKDGKAA